MKILNSVKLMKLLVEVCRNAKNDADQDDINCEIPGRSKLLETKLTSVSRAKNISPQMWKTSVNYTSYSIHQQHNKQATWLTVCFSLTLVILISKLALSTCTKNHAHHLTSKVRDTVYFFLDNKTRDNNFFFL
jgi:small-conductance mechanosensitive channel